MASTERQARHVFHVPTSGMDRVHAWLETTGEPVFSWGRHVGDATGPLFGPLRKTFLKWLQETGPDCPVTVYHDAPSADAFGMLDPAPQKVIHLHAWHPRWERNFDWAIRCTGKVLLSHPEQSAKLRERFGWIPERFIQCVEEPVLSGLSERQSGATGPRERTGIWLFGKRWRLHGNRLRSIVDRWPEERGGLEIIASGSSRPAWAKRDNIIWSRDLPFEFALQRLFTWDSTLLIDNYALDAPWLMRALSLDCFPLIPDGDHPGRTSQWEVDFAPRPYAWGDINDAQRLLKEWRSERQNLLPSFRDWVQSLTPGKSEDRSFTEKWDSIKQQFMDQRSPRLRRRRVYPGWYPVAWFERLQRIRAGN